MDTYFPIETPWKNNEVPHGVIEVNQCCNLKCHGCYKNATNVQKPVEQIVKEIDFLLSQRNVSTVSLAGGEPLMHPDLEKVIAYIASKDLRPAILTNGSLLSHRKLSLYKKAGLEAVFIHIDENQGRRPDISGGTTQTADLEALREKYISLCTELGLDVALVITLYKNYLPQLGKFVEYCFNHPNICGLLATCYSQNLNFKEKDNDGLSLDNRDVYAYMETEAGLFPNWYVPSSHRKEELRWLFYTGVNTVAQDGEVESFHFHPKHKLANKLIPRLGRWINGKYAYDAPMNEKEKRAVLRLYSYLTFNPKTVIQSHRFLKKANKNKNIKYFSAVFQQAPNRLPNGDWETCHHCPDSTVRNGKLVPVCIVDKVEPL